TRRSSRRCRRRRGHRLAIINLQFHLAKTQRLARLEHRFGDFFVVDESPVRRANVPDDNITSAQQNLRMMARNRTVGDLKGVVLDASYGGAFNVQLERPSGHALVQDNEFGHRLYGLIMSTAVSKS